MLVEFWVTGVRQYLVNVYINCSSRVRLWFQLEGVEQELNKAGVLRSGSRTRDTRILRHDIASHQQGRHHQRFGKVR